MKKSILLFVAVGALLWSQQAVAKNEVTQNESISPIVKQSKESKKALKEAEKELKRMARIENRGKNSWNPILPARTIRLPNGLITFIIKIRIISISRMFWCDPVVATGYDYEIKSGPSVTHLELPKGIGDNKYNLLSYDEQADQFVDSGVVISGGIQYAFDKPVRKFAVRGIETSAGLNPDDDLAFPSGLRFTTLGNAELRMTPVSMEIN